MARKKQRNKSGRTAEVKPSVPPKKTVSLAMFILGPKAKWIFFAVYLLITIVLFRAFLFGDGMLFGSDTIPDGIYTRQYYKDYHAEYGGIPRWNSFLLGGIPFIDGMHGDTFYPAAWLKFFLPLTRALGHKLILHVFLAGVFMYVFLRTLKIRREAAFLGGLMYMLAPSFVSWLYGGHDAKMYVIALLPLAFAFLEAGMDRPKIFKFAGLGAVMGLLILTSQIQTAYYSYWALGLYWLFRLFTTPDNVQIRLRKSGLFIAAVIIAVTLGAVQLLPSYKYSTTQSVRAGAERTGYEYATSFAMNFEETAGMIVPSFPGINYLDGRSDPQGMTYWGKNAFKLNTEYHGIVPIIFGILALLVCRGKQRWFLLGLACLSLIYALGASTPFYHLFYSLVPGVKNFRAPSMIIFLFAFAFTILAANFISSLLDGKTLMSSGSRRLVYAVGVIVFLAVVVSMMGRSFFDIWRNIFYNSMPDAKLSAMTANIPFFTRDLWTLVLLSSVSLMGVWMFQSKQINTTALTVLVALVIVIDCSVVNRKFITVINPQAYPNSAPDRIVYDLQGKIQESALPFRILGLYSGRTHNYYAMFGIQAANGMHNNELQTYELFKGGRNLTNYTSGWIENGGLNPDGLQTNNFMKVAGVKYIPLQTSEGVFLFENEYAYERAFIVHDCVTVHNDTMAVEMLKDTTFDPSEKVIITSEVENTYNLSRAVSTVQEYNETKDGFRINADFQAPGFLVLSENYVPYWMVEIDGEPAEIHRAYGTFMAVECTEGNHLIQFMFRSQPYETGKKLTLASFFFVIVTFAASGVLYSMRGRKKTA